MTLGRRADAVARFLENEAGVVGVTVREVRVRAGIVAIGMGVVAVEAGIMVGASIARIGMDIIGFGVGVVGADMREVSVGGAGVGGAGIGGASVVLVRAGVVGIKTGSRSRPVQIFPTKLRLTLALWSFLSKRS